MTRARHRDEDRGAADLAGPGFDGRQLVAGVLDRQLFPGGVHRAHRALQVLREAVLEPAELAVTYPWPACAVLYSAYGSCKMTPLRLSARAECARRMSTVTGTRARGATLRRRAAGDRTRP